MCPKCGHVFDAEMIHNYCEELRVHDRRQRNWLYFRATKVFSWILHFTTILSVPTFLPNLPLLYIYIAFGLAMLLSIIYARKGGNFLYCALYSICLGPLCGIYLAIVGKID